MSPQPQQINPFDPKRQWELEGTSGILFRRVKGRQQCYLAAHFKRAAINAKHFQDKSFARDRIRYHRQRGDILTWKQLRDDESSTAPTSTSFISIDQDDHPWSAASAQPQPDNSAAVLPLSPPRTSGSLSPSSAGTDFDFDFDFDTAAMFENPLISPPQSPSLAPSDTIQPSLAPAFASPDVGNLLVDDSPDWPTSAAPAATSPAVDGNLPADNLPDSPNSATPAKRRRGNRGGSKQYWKKKKAKFAAMQASTPV